MLEVLAVVGLWKWIGRLTEDKGRQPVGYQVMGVLMWFGGEILGAIVGVAIMLAQGKSLDGGFPVAPYLAALLGAVVGGALAVALVAILPAADLEYEPEQAAARPAVGGEPLSTPQPCVVCQKVLPSLAMTEYQGNYICPACKPGFLAKLEDHGPTPAAPS